MTTFDEEMLQNALREAADGFAVSDYAVDRIIDEARGSTHPDRQPRIRGLIERTGRVRSTLMAAVASVIVLAIAVPLFNTESPALAPSASGVSHNTSDQSALGPYTPAGAPASSATGTGFAIGEVVPTSSKTLANTSAQGKVSNSSKSASIDGSLRVEEVGTINLTVGGTRFQSTLTKLTDFATTDGGFVASTQSHTGTKAKHSYSTGLIVLQVPERQFNMLVDQVRHADVATSVVTSATDVTGQYVDLQARINALEVSRTQYLKIMARTTSIGGILSVQNQLNSIQSQIEQLQAQLNLLNSETTYATLTVSLSQSGHVIVPPSHPRTGIDKAWHESLHGFAAGVEWLIRIAGPVLFALLLLAALLLLGRWTWRATERRRGGIS